MNVKENKQTNTPIMGKMWCALTFVDFKVKYASKILKLNTFLSDLFVAFLCRINGVSIKETGLDNHIEPC